jgi:ribosomal protein S18 acetylase RimI-like enzyme
VAGFYTLSAAQISVTQLPDRFKKNLPRYPSVPAVRIGRLAIDIKFQGQGLGSTLLINAIYRSIRADIAAYAVIVVTKDDAAIAFYRHHGFLDFECARAHPVRASGTIRKGFFFCTCCRDCWIMAAISLKSGANS